MGTRLRKPTPQGDPVKGLVSPKFYLSWLSETTFCFTQTHCWTVPLPL